MKVGMFLLVVGGVLVILGLLFILLGRFGAVSWIGHLPGDLNIQGKNFSLHIPLMTCLVISLVLTLLFALVRWLGIR
jgi:hypothetical protein